MATPAATAEITANQPVPALQSARRIVIKMGTNVLLNREGKIAFGRLYNLAESIASLRRQQREILLVVSGAVALGVNRIGLKERPRDLARMQACAAIGQSRLMSIYADAFSKLDQQIAQVLLTEDDFRDPVRYANLKATFSALLELGVIPVINENDTVSTVEIERPETTERPLKARPKRIFGDNDKLSALVMAHVKAELLILLSDVDGVFDGEPGSSSAKFLDRISRIDDRIRGMARGPNGRGRGGMLSKLEAAEIALHAGGCAIIANGAKPRVIERICSGEPVGTFFQSENAPSESAQ